VADGHVEVVDAFVYLGCLIDSSGGSRGEVLRRIRLARSCMNNNNNNNQDNVYGAVITAVTLREFIRFI